jgi:hypothetical protein
VSARYHADRCDSHETTAGPIGSVVWCDGSCLNEPCDSCEADTGESCWPGCELVPGPVCPACGVLAPAPGDRYCAGCASAADRSAWAAS